MHDKLNDPCYKCEHGYYMETSIHDDWEGKLHCNICKDEIDRWMHVEEKIINKTQRNTMKSDAEEILERAVDRNVREKQDHLNLRRIALLEREVRTLYIILNDVLSQAGYGLDEWAKKELMAIAHEYGMIGLPLLNCVEVKQEQKVE